MMMKAALLVLLASSQEDPNKILKEAFESLKFSREDPGRLFLRPALVRLAAGFVRARDTEFSDWIRGECLLAYMGGEGLPVWLAQLEIGDPNPVLEYLDSDYAEIDDFVEVALLQARKGDAKAALETLDRGRARAEKEDRVGSDLVVAYARLGKSQFAMRYAADLAEGEDRATALNVILGLSEYFAETRDFPLAERCARAAALLDARRRSRVWDESYRWAVAYARAGQRDGLEPCIRMGETESAQAGRRAGMADDLALGLARRGDFQGALDVLSSVEKQWQDGLSLGYAWVAQLQAESGDLEGAARSARHAKERVKAWEHESVSAVCRALIAARLYSDAWEVAIGAGEKLLADACYEVAKAHALRDGKAALVEARKIKDRSARCSALVGIAEGILERDGK